MKTTLLRFISNKIKNLVNGSKKNSVRETDRETHSALRKNSQNSAKIKSTPPMLVEKPKRRDPAKKTIRNKTVKSAKKMFRSLSNIKRKSR